MAYIKDSTVPVFRFDDVSGNADGDKLNNIARLIESACPTASIMMGLSMACHDNCGERVFPSILNAYSDYREFYNVRKLLETRWTPDVIVASHGLVHADHRLMHKSAQELSILTSCSLTMSKIFIPPFNKWNADTESICQEHGIELIKWEDGWLSAEHNKFDPSHKLWYIHSYAWTVESFKEWLNGK